MKNTYINQDTSLDLCASLYNLSKTELLSLNCSISCDLFCMIFDPTEATLFLSSLSSVVKFKLSYYLISLVKITPNSPLFIQGV